MIRREEAKKKSILAKIVSIKSFLESKSLQRSNFEENNYNPQLLAEKDQTIQELRETVEVLLKLKRFWNSRSRNLNS